MKKLYIFPVILLLLSLVACAGGPRVNIPSSPLQIGTDGRTIFPGATVATNDQKAVSRPSTPKDFQAYRAQRSKNATVLVAKSGQSDISAVDLQARQTPLVKENNSKPKGDYVTRAEFEARVGDLEDATMDQWQMIIRLKCPNVKYLSIIHFSAGKTTLENFDAKMTAELKKITDNGYSIFEIWGSSDRTGNAKRNEILAKERANYVAGTINDLQPGTIASNQVKFLGENVVAGKKEHNRTVTILCQ